MKTIFKSFKFRIYPNKEQEILLAKHFGACRFVFNHYLSGGSAEQDEACARAGLTALGLAPAL